MGRRAKHLSLAQQASASRENSLKYIQSPNIEVELPVQPPAVLHSDAKLDQHLWAPSLTSLSSPPIPIPTARMLELYDQALPMARDCSKTLRSPDALDESDLMRWKEDPPFVEDDDTADPYSPPTWHSQTSGGGTARCATP
ncbi:hypothetical protein B0H13DRAFT_2375078 [Mycena leptocephala]|nr:hypothetical protein B0H13DRAFT_2375078 [Mycena leptocephala]